MVSMAQTLPVLTGGIDLSVGPMMTLANCLASVLVIGSPWQLALGIVLVLAAGALAGFVNGCIVVYGRIQPIIATLATGAVFVGISLFLRPTPGGKINEDLAWVATNALSEMDNTFHWFPDGAPGWFANGVGRLPVPILLILLVIAPGLAAVPQLRHRPRLLRHRLLRRCRLHVRRAHRAQQACRLHRGRAAGGDRRALSRAADRQRQRGHPAGGRLHAQFHRRRGGGRNLAVRRLVAGRSGRCSGRWCCARSRSASASSTATGRSASSPTRCCNRSSKASSCCSPSRSGPRGCFA